MQRADPEERVHHGKEGILSQGYGITYIGSKDPLACGDEQGWGRVAHQRTEVIG